MSAERILYFKKNNSDGTFVEMVVWIVPPDKARPHGFKYRLHFGTTKGVCIVRYDNETNKGDHRHFGNREEPYHFTGLEKLLADFQHDVKKKGTKK